MVGARVTAQSDPGNRQALPPPSRGEPAFNIPGVVLAFIALCALLHFVRSYAISPAEDIAVLLRAAFIPLRYSGADALDLYAFTSPLTYSLLHGGMAHLAINMIWLAAFGSPLANRIGALRFVLFWAATALAAAGLHYLVYPESPVPLVGASGAISGFQIDRGVPGRSRFAGPVLPFRAVLRRRAVVTFLGVWMAINLATGLLSGAPDSSAVIAWEVHIGGFLVGFFASRLFDRRRAPRRY